jgi:hypothetical protein
VWNCFGAFLKEGRFLGISGEQSEEKTPKNRAEKNRVAVFLVFVRQILSYCRVGFVTKL